MVLENLWLLLSGLCSKSLRTTDLSSDTFFYLLGPLLKTTYLPFLVLSFLFNLRILAACHVVGI